MADLVIHCLTSHLFLRVLTHQYNLTEAVKEWMVERNVKQLSMHEQMTEKSRIAEKAAEAEENKKVAKQEKVSEQIRHGTLCVRTSTISPR